MKRFIGLFICFFFATCAFAEGWDKYLGFGLAVPFSTATLSWDNYNNTVIKDSDGSGKGATFDIQIRGANSSNLALMMNYNLGYASYHIDDNAGTKFDLSGFAQTLLVGIGGRVVNSSQIDLILSAVIGFSTYILSGEEKVTGYNVKYDFVMNAFDLGADIFLNAKLSKKVSFYASGTLFLTLGGFASVEQSFANYKISLTGNPKFGGINFTPRLGIAIKI